MSEAIKPCPCCGAPAVVRDGGTNPACLYWIECSVCEIGTKYHRSETWPTDPADAALVWNRRVLDPDVRKCIERIADSLAAHGSHWRQPYQAYCYDMAAALRSLLSQAGDGGSEG